MDGIILINKEPGCTSRDVVNKLEKHFNTKKMGHTGTLDPLASGVLVICLGRALKISELLTSNEKEYIAGVILGLETDTLDTDGKIIKEVNVDISKEEITKVVLSFKGKYMQEVPAYSAVKVNGRKLYEYARSGIKVKLPSKEVEIKDINVIDDIKCQDGKIYFKIRCTVSKGTYVRSLIRDIGNKLGTVAIMNSLVRTRQGNFLIKDSYTLDEVTSNNYKLIKITDVFPNIPVLKVDDKLAFKIRNGVIMEKFFDTEMAFITDNGGNLLALYKNINDKSRAYKMFI